MLVKDIESAISCLAVISKEFRCYSMLLPKGRVSMRSGGNMRWRGGERGEREKKREERDDRGKRRERIEGEGDREGER